MWLRQERGWKEKEKQEEERRREEERRGVSATMERFIYDQNCNNVNWRKKKTSIDLPDTLPHRQAIDILLATTPCSVQAEITQGKTSLVACL